MELKTVVIDVSAKSVIKCFVSLRKVMAKFLKERGKMVTYKHEFIAAIMGEDALEHIYIYIDHARGSCFTGLCLRLNFSLLFFTTECLYAAVAYYKAFTSNTHTYFRV